MNDGKGVTEVSAGPIIYPRALDSAEGGGCGEKNQQSG
jgi:hypothetical protein